MAIQPYKKVRTDDPFIRLLQDAIEIPLRDISNRAILDGQIVSGIELSSSGTNVVDHKLQKKLTGWILIGKSANAQVWDEQSANSRPQQTLFLRASANVTVNLWVF